MSCDDLSQHWIEDHQDVAQSDVVLVYAEEGDVLRGAFVEAGMGIALEKLVVAVGDGEFGTWVCHPQVTRVPNLESALRWMSL
jgi:hypothetical protein